MQARTALCIALIDYFRRENANLRKMVCNRLGFSSRLVLYWPHIGLITKHKGYGAYEHTEIDLTRGCNHARIIGAGSPRTAIDELGADRRGRGHRHPRQLARIARDQARSGRRGRRAQCRGRRQVPRQESRRSPAARAWHRDQPRLRRRRAREPARPVLDADAHAAERPLARDRRLVHPRPAEHDAQLQLPDAAGGRHRPGQGVQVAAGGLRRGRHRRHDRRRHAQAARPGVDADVPFRPDGLYGSRRRIRSAVLGLVQLEERREHLRRDGRRASISSGTSAATASRS